MTPASPSREPRRPRSVPSPATTEDVVSNELLSLLGEQLGKTIQQAADPHAGGRRLKNVKVTAEYSDDRRSHDMAGPFGYSISSNWFTQLLAQLFIANAITRSELCVFLYVAGGQKRGTGITEYTQQEITDGLNKLAVKTPNSKKIVRPTVNRAVRRLCELGWLERVGNGLIRLNVRLWFFGGSNEQRDVLAEIESNLPQGADPADRFPHQIGPELIHHQEELDLGLSGTPLTARPRRRTG